MQVVPSLKENLKPDSESGLASSEPTTWGVNDLNLSGMLLILNCFYESTKGYLKVLVLRALIYSTRKTGLGIKRARFGKRILNLNIVFSVLLQFQV